MFSISQSYTSFGNSFWSCSRLFFSRFLCFRLGFEISLLLSKFGLSLNAHLLNVLEIRKYISQRSVAISLNGLIVSGFKFARVWVNTHFQRHLDIMLKRLI